ncbi:hypothetical protein MATL_G00081530 [Megalops atlanticus]|uniref:R3H domain-containing protein n=1 Tax=Megalops atlanticus TaxID=7932 RepID=A0A9D3Q7F1_MEGAT|nr:hypothetical protein MATL_G00081530 [Megalops atlanticus]
MIPKSVLEKNERFDVERGLEKAALCVATLAFPCVDGCYLPKQENEFVTTVVDELEAFLQRNQQKSVLLFPPLPSRFRYLIHRSAESYPLLSTFSVGGAGWSRRVAVCFSHLRLPPENDSDAEGGACEQTRLRGKGVDSSKRSPAPEPRQTRSRSQRRPDKAIYIPRAMRERERPAPPAPPATGSAGCSLSLSPSEESCPNTPEAPPPANQETACDSADESLGEPEACPVLADAKGFTWDQDISIFMAMTLDDQSDDGSSAAQPEAEAAKDSGDCMQEISAHLKEVDVTIENVHSDYSGYENLWIAPDEFAHVIEIYDFPALLKTEDLLDAFTDFSEGGLKIKWVDNTHALGVFSSQAAAVRALTLQHPLLKVRSLYEGSKRSKGKALRRAEFIQPVKERPRTDTAVARRMVTRALGLQKPGSRGKRY